MSNSCPINVDTLCSCLSFVCVLCYVLNSKDPLCWIGTKYIIYCICTVFSFERVYHLFKTFEGSVGIFNMRIFNNSLISYCFRVLISFWLLLGYCGRYSFGLRTYKPVVLVHGILTNYTTISDLAERIVKVSCSQLCMIWCAQFRLGFRANARVRTGFVWLSEQMAQVTACICTMLTSINLHLNSISCDAEI